jgi:hypothetical protein
LKLVFTPISVNDSNRQQPKKKKKKKSKGCGPVGENQGVQVHWDVQ